MDSDNPLPVLRHRSGCAECGKDEQQLRRGFCHACYERKRRRGDLQNLGQLRNEQHGNWRGSDIAIAGHRARAKRMFDVGPCERCGAARSERHHKDGDPSNNSLDNIAILCRRCHQIVDGRLAKAVERLTGRRDWTPGMVG